MSPRARERGFALAELVVSGGLLAASLIGLMAVWATQERADKAQWAQVRAVALADDVMESLASVPAAEIAARTGDRPPIIESNVTFQPVVQALPVPGSATLRRVRVEIRAAGRTAVLETLRTTRE